MINFPATCLDNFYQDPDSVVEFAMHCLEHYPSVDDGNYPGKRTIQLHEIDSKFFDIFCRKLFSIYYDFSKTNINWVVETSFQYIHSFSDNKQNIKNKGWIHLDDCSVFAGVVYLTKDADKDSGTSLFKLKDSSLLDSTDKKYNFFKKNIDDDYDVALENHNSCFIETVRFNNIYNRMISFDSSVYHGVNNFHTGCDSKSRLTQVFFVKRIESNSLPPVKRSMSF
jgi:hypothetical protein